MPNRSDQINSGMTDVPASNTSEGSKLAWPPKAEDLRRLYLEQKLSAAKIAAPYGLNQKYASPKTAESTILYHLKRNGIMRRDKAEHARKVTKEMEDEWIRRYEGGESLKKIADAMKAIGVQVDHVTVFNHLRDRGLKLRDKVEAQIKAVTKHQKTPFSGDPFERAYLLGFVRGDLHVKRHGRAMRVHTGSTHPAMIDLITYLFVRYGPVRIYPRLSKLVGYEWTIEADLDHTFEFLLREKLSYPSEILSKESLIYYLAGVFDAEGSIFLRGDRQFGPEISFANKDSSLLEWVASFLTERGLYAWTSKPDSSGVSHVAVWRRGDVIKLLSLVTVRHPEKKAKFRLLLNRKSQAEIKSEWYKLLEEIERDCREFLRLAENELRFRRSSTSNGAAV